MISNSDFHHSSFCPLSLPPILSHAWLLFPSSSVFLLFTTCSGRQHVGSGDSPVPHPGGVHYVLLVRSELSAEGGSGAL